MQMNIGSYESQALFKKMQAEMNVKVENTEMAVNEKLKMHKKFINDIELKAKAKADVQKVEAVLNELNELKGSIEQQFTAASRSQGNLEIRIKDNTAKIVSMLSLILIAANSTALLTGEGGGHQEGAQEHGLDPR